MCLSSLSFRFASRQRHDTRSLQRTNTVPARQMAINLFDLIVENDWTKEIRIQVVDTQSTADAVRIEMQWERVVDVSPLSTEIRRSDREKTTDEQNNPSRRLT